MRESLSSRVSAKVQDARTLLLFSGHQNQSDFVPELWRLFIVMESHYICFLGIYWFASNTLPSKPPLNSLPVQIQWVGSLALWDSIPSNISEPGRPKNLPWVKGSWKLGAWRREARNPVYTAAKGQPNAPTSLSSTGTSAVYTGSRACMRLILYTELI